MTLDGQDDLLPRRPTIRDVARLAGVSVVTVSRVLNGRPDVARKTRERVRSVIADLGWVPAAAAQALPKGGHPAIGVLTYEAFASAPFYRRVIEGATVEATARGYALIVTPVGTDADSPALGVDFLISHRAAGVVVARPQPFYTLAFYDALQRIPVPIVTTGNYRDLAERIFAVDIDVRAGARNLTRHMIALGHRSFALIRGHVHIGGADGRVAGHREALAEASLPFDERLVESSDWTLEDRLRAARLAGARPSQLHGTGLSPRLRCDRRDPGPGELRPARPGRRGRGRLRGRRGVELPHAGPDVGARAGA